MRLFPLLKLSFARDLIYRANFWSAVISKLGFLIVTILWFSIMYTSVLHVKEWSYAETMFFLATFQLIETITVAIFSNSFANWHQHINSGSLDLVLTKPIDTQLLLSLHAVSIPQLLTILAPLTLLVQLAFQHAIFPSWLVIGEYIIGIILAISIFYNVWLMLMTGLFWFIGIPHWHNLFFRITSFMQVPPVVYEGAVKFLFYFVVPVFAAVMLPLQIVWQKSVSTLGILFLTAFMAFIVSRLFFQFGLKKYNSASS